MQKNRAAAPANRMKIMIVGAGIAGLTAAYWLERAGHEVTIVEQSKQLRDAGYMIDFFGDGYDVAEKMNLLGELEKIHYQISHLEFLDGSGKQEYSIPYQTFRALFDNRHFNFMRGDLERVLYEKIADGVNIQFGKTVTQLHVQGEKVIAELTDGSQEEFDFVVIEWQLFSFIRPTAGLGI